MCELMFQQVRDGVRVSINTAKGGYFIVLSSLGERVFKERFRSLSGATAAFFNTAKIVTQ